jgi:hypothetical protein
MDLIELKPQGASDKSVEIASEGEERVSKEILIKELEQMFRNLETVKHRIMDLEPEVERSMLVRRTLENGISCYRKLFEDRRREKNGLHMLKRRLIYIFSRKQHIHFSLVL